MPLRIVVTNSGNYCISGLLNSFAAYERAIVQGKVPCPFKVEFRDSQVTWKEGYSSIGWRCQSPTVSKPGRVVASGPMPLTPNGKLKIPLL